MSTPADKVVITVQATGYSVECYTGRDQICSQNVECWADRFEKTGDDLFQALPIELADALHDLDLQLIDVAIGLEAA